MAPPYFGSPQSLLLPVITAASLDVVYFVSAVGFVGMWGEFESFWQYKDALLRGRILYWSLFYAATSAFIVVLDVEKVTLPSLLYQSFFMLWLGWNKVRDTRVQIINGGSPPLCLPKFNKQVIVVTGANTGIGKETVRQLTAISDPDTTIFLLCRNVSKGQEAADEIQAKCNLRVVACDLTSFASVRSAVNVILKAHSSIDILINNAGVMMKDLSYTTDGNETCLQANFLGHFLLTSLLLPHIKERIINVTSSTYKLSANEFDADNLDELQCRGKRRYSLFGQYGATKYCNILHTKYLDKAYPNLFTAAIHPGLVRTSVVRNMPWYLTIPNTMFAMFVAALQKTPEAGAWCTVHTATCKTTSAEESGQYWVNRKTQPLIVKERKVQEQAEKLWKWSSEKVDLTAAECQVLQKASSIKKSQ